MNYPVLLNSDITCKNNRIHKKHKSRANSYESKKTISFTLVSKDVNYEAGTILQ